MTLVSEAIYALRGCWRLMRGDPDAFDDFNLSIDGFWRSFAMIVPVMVLAYPAFISDHAFKVETAVAAGLTAPPLALGRDYAFLLASIALWALAAALLARLFAVDGSYVRYMIVYNWMSIPALALAAVPSILHLAAGAHPGVVGLLGIAIFAGLAYVSWYVAKTGLETTGMVAFAFVLADYALSYALGSLIRG